MKSYIPQSIDPVVSINAPPYAIPIEPMPPYTVKNNQNIYPPFIEEQMKKYYDTLSEKDKRHYSAIEALKLGHGGITYISRVLGCSIPTIRKGIKEMNRLPEDNNRRIRKPGGGRKPYYVIYPDIDEHFLHVLKEYTAGDPMDEKVIWTNLKQQRIAELLSEKPRINVSVMD